MWNYKIKVDPWTVFGVIAIHLKPASIIIDDLWAATMLDNSVEGDERVLTVELGHKSQDDSTFSLDGRSGPIKSTRITCRNTEVLMSDCGLEPTFSILNNCGRLVRTIEPWTVQLFLILLL